MLTVKPADLIYKCAGAPATLPEKAVSKVDTKQKSANVKTLMNLYKMEEILWQKAKLPEYLK